MKKTLQKLATSASLATIGLSNAALAFADEGDRVDISNSFGVNTIAGSGGDVVTSDPSVLISNIVNIVFIVAAAITFAFLIYGAISWITSGGDKSKVETARNRITAAVIGLLILAAVWALFNLALTVAFGSGDITINPLNTT